ncbi:MAG: DUF1049 domain-containing protein [Proteobacteria bacterium]|nr:DUF1049 domain-containing protein [Pseudomonadota bacterium]HQR02997.1 lipopolysaccharide assembly protein LapA domain-containing protein [Rhodocyclaceae bacterium]
MKALIWVLRVVVFIALLGLAIKNSASVDLHFFFDQHVGLPLSLALLGAFAAGAAVGVTAAVASLVRQWREIKRLKRDTKME